MAEIDRQIARARHEALFKVEARVNARRFLKPPFSIGDYVYYIRPKAIVGPKLDPPWQGPYKILSREGQHSYRLCIPNAKPLLAHVTQLKRCHWAMPKGPMLHLRIPPEQSGSPGVASMSRGCIDLTLAD